MVAMRPGSQQDVHDGGEDRVKASAAIGRQHPQGRQCLTDEDSRATVIETLEP